MVTKVNVIGIHGLGNQSLHNPQWGDEWGKAVKKYLNVDGKIEIDFIPFSYDDIFEKIHPTFAESSWAFAKLVGSGIVSGVGGLFGRRELTSRGFLDSINDSLKWTAGYVVAWMENEKFKGEVRKRLWDAIQKHQPAMLLGHSLGSLISYDALNDVNCPAEVTQALKNTIYVTLGAQIGNPFVVRNLTPGRIAPMDNIVRRWVHLYNPEDDVFTAEISLPDSANFQQVRTFFDDPGWEDHSALSYLSHNQTLTNLWAPVRADLLSREMGDDAARGRVRAVWMPGPAAQPERAPRRRAVLIGINDYPKPEMCLQGCVNDVFEMSATLQECNFSPDDIRIVLNDRATAEGIRERFRWLLEEAQAGDELVFFYSGHGAQLPTYGDGDVADRMDETLVPHDFDWSAETCITDDSIFQLYSQLPYDTRLIMIFDCCHSGGIDRNGMLKQRGIDAPDDIRHRSLRWDTKRQMWVPRELEPINPNFTDNEEVRTAYFGESGAVSRLGRSASLRINWDHKDSKKVAKEQADKGVPRHVGPFLPLILEACQENESAYEYRHGVQSFGAFTYCLTHLLRERKRVTFNELVVLARDRLLELGYAQTPAVIGPTAIQNAQIPFGQPLPAPKKKAAKKAAPKKAGGVKKKE